MQRARDFRQGSGALCPEHLEGTMCKITLRRIRLNRDGYDSRGFYWGMGVPLYWAGSDDGTVDMVFRAADRKLAKIHIRQLYPKARF